MKPFQLLCCFLGLSYAVFSQSPAQWRGPERSGIYNETNLLKEWPAEGPAMIWSAEGIGKGYSSAAADGKAVYITGMKDSTDILTSISLDGKILWQTPFGPSFSGSFPDTRTTPTVDGDLVYVISGGGTVACVNKTDGKIKWSVKGLEKFSGKYGQWGICESPLVAGSKVIYTPAGPKTTMVALDKNTGETIWQSATLNDTGSYVSPRLIKYGNKDIIVTIINKYLLGVDLANGNILWTFDYGTYMPEQGLKIWPGAPKTNAITPLFDNGNLYITQGYNHVGVMFRISDDGSRITKIWTDTVLDCHHGGVVLLDGYIYGSNWINNGLGNWCCLDWKTGKLMWQEKWFTKGPIISADGMLYCQEEKTGNVGLVKPDPQKFTLTSSFKAPLGKGPYWAHPSISNGILYIRHGDVLMAYDIRKK
ncbi:MAG: PQQ-binding-like beta-propeller repeat protein [Bacteroidota bacterium]|jgi:outer membrane protein assembly factor BamB